MSVRSGLVDLFNAVLRPLGFRHRGDNWYRVGESVYVVVNVQSSKWDGSCYVNIGFSPSAWLEKSWLPETKCPIRFRIEALKRVSLADCALLGERILDEMGEPAWREALSDRIGTRVAETVGSIESLDHLKTFLTRETSERMFIHKNVRELLRFSL